MEFAKPELLNLLWLLLPLAFLLSWARKYRQERQSKFIGKQLQNEVIKGYDIKVIFRKDLLLLSAFGLLFFALARPQWGYQWQEIKTQGVDILLAVDVSKSMLTQDVTPSRLERAKLAIRDLVQDLNGDRVGLIAFAGEAFLTCPLTNDYGGFFIALSDLSINSVPRGGTNIGSAIREATRIYKDSHAKDKSIIVITDGDNLEGDPLAAARQAAAEGIKVFCIGVGTPNGELIQITNDKGNIEYLKNDQGEYVLSRLNEELMQEISLTTGGAYVKAGAVQFGLNVIYENYLSKQDKQEFEARKQRVYYERFQYPLFLAVALLFLEMIIGKQNKK
jgi:Ca-activated chloride channel family protein